MNTGDLVMVSKIAEYNANPHGLGPSYWLKGKVMADFVVGEPMLIARTSRMKREEDPEDAPLEIEVGGAFRSSPIVAIDGRVIKTINSLYSISIIEP